MRGFFIITLVCTLFATTVNAQSKSVRTVDAFSEIYVSVNSTVHITQGDVQKVEIVSERPDLGTITTTVKKRALVIKEKNSDKFLKLTSKDRDDSPVHIYIVTPTIDAISLSGRGMITSDSKIESHIIDINLSGAGIIRLPNIKASTTNVSMSGAGEVTVKGDNSEGKLQLKLSGSGKFIGGELICKTGVINIAGSGSATINITDSVDSTIAGSGKLSQKGNGEITSTTMGGGTVTRD